MRALGLLGAVDRVVGAMRAKDAEAENAATRGAFPHIAFPPPALVYEVQSYASLRQFMDTGEAHAAAIAALIERHAPAPDTTSQAGWSILEWGCGPGRILRPLAARLSAALHGCDPNPDCVAAAKAYAAPAAIVRSGFDPPAPFPPAHFHAIYGVSILTHLDEPAARAWVGEIARLLRPAGCAILTTHGEAHTAGLGAAERAQFGHGRHVALGGAAHGSRAFSSYTPPAAMADFAGAAGLAITAHHADGPASIIGQDVWVLHKP